MGGHGGLNILPQKRWNVYNYENREKVRRDEEEQEKNAQIEKDKQKSIEWEIKRSKMKERSKSKVNSSECLENSTTLDQKHINFFEGLESKASKGDKKKKLNDSASLEKDGDIKYSLGYGSIDKDGKKPWYASKSSTSLLRYDVKKDENFLAFKPKGEKRKPDSSGENKGEVNKKGRKSMEELRNERIQREQSERKRSVQIPVRVPVRDLDSKKTISFS